MLRRLRRAAKHPVEWQTTEREDETMSKSKPKKAPDISFSFGASETLKSRQKKRNSIFGGIGNAKSPSRKSNRFSQAGGS